jgi:thiamine pyrophosphate-dependent acetolactate synthase large subunit-like protein
MIGKDAFQEINAVAMTQHITKYAKCLTHEDDIIKEICGAIDTALDGKK